MRPAAATERPPQPVVAAHPGAANAFPAAVAAYLILMLSLGRYYTYNLYPDSTSYLSIAQAYARGQFWDAVNGYWSPLYCWLLAPLLAAGIDVLIAPKLLALIVAVLTLVGVRRLARRLALTDLTIAAVTIGAVLPLVCWSLTYITPDFLLVAVLTWYLSEVVAWSPDYGARAGFGVGALAGLAYLSKQYALPFVVAHLALAAALHYHQHRSRASRAMVRRWLLAAYVALFAVAAPWVATMSAKYGRLTAAASGTYNWYLPATGFNVGTHTLAPPPFTGAVSAWVDPTFYAAVQPAQGAPADSFRRTIPRWWGYRALLEQVYRDALMLVRFSFFALFILAAAAVLAVRDARQYRDYRYAQVGLALGLFLGGYQIATAWLVERLVWIVTILLAVLSGLVFQRLAPTVRPAVRMASAALLVISFLPLPLLRLAQAFDEGRDVYAAAAMAQRAGVHGRLASLNRYADSLRAAFFMDSSYYGRIAAPPATLERVVSELRSHRIEFLLIWPEARPEDNALYRELTARFPDVTQGTTSQLSVLDVRSLGATVNDWTSVR